ncbi:MAG: MtnX-like HAD-IB family phosphatase [Candidatus Omnitrophica bacterium]|nr:MtnX-like HAD-IB family phosphatase [Candidatus Omnitrophota bacterium]
MKEAKEYAVFFDFDNTITTYDVIDDMLLWFSMDNRWINLEKQWKKGKISSRECLKGQVEGIRITQKSLEEYLSKIKIDPYFKKLIGLLDSKKIKIAVLSDNFYEVLSYVFRHHRIKGLKIYSNRVELTKDKLTLNFPYANKHCLLCAHCKKESLMANIKDNSTSVYIGDGLSDVCPSQHVDIVFAKADLLRYFRANRLKCVPFKTLKDVYRYFKRIL